MSTELPKIMYHYTSYDKLQCILKYGTLRFKESTESNDALDTVWMINILSDLEFPKEGQKEDIAAARDFMLGYFRREDYQRRYISLVSCFSRVPDSRLLWDAYTMNRPSNKKCKYGENLYCYDADLKYNGVCIAFDVEKLKKQVQKTEGKVCERTYLQPIYYGTDTVKSVLNGWLKDACEQVEILSKDEDQSQDLISEIRLKLISREYAFKLKKCIVYPMRDFYSKVEAFSPFFKHGFWNEEKEIRCSLCLENKKEYDGIQIADGARYYDVPIDAECIDHVILGPEFSELDLQQIKKHNDYKIDFSKFEMKKSLGTGVIRNN